VPLDALDGPLVLPLLGLLVEQPAHPYELTRRLADRYRQLDSRRSSVTTLAKRLATLGLIAPRRPRRVQGRPARTVYELTDAGYAHMRRCVVRGIESAPAGSTAFILAISYVALLPIGLATKALRHRLSTLRSELEAASAVHSLPEYQMLEGGYWRQVLQGDIEWVQTLVGRLETGGIGWPASRSRRR
jgi:DNA-binding PadR family transcriptional regulator